jgi:hypothetical protein
MKKRIAVAMATMLATLAIFLDGRERRHGDCNQRA